MRNDNDLLTRLALGAAAGLAGTMAMMPTRMAAQKYAPGTLTPTSEDPGQFMVNQAERALPETARRKIPDAVEDAAAQSTHMGYGMTWGAIYAATRPRGGSPLLDGAVLGLTVWAAGYMGWLPATGLAAPPWKNEPRQVLGEIAQHAVYGMATVAAYDLIEQYA